VSDTSQGPGWWVASDGKWYPPETHPNYVAPSPTSAAEAPTAAVPSVDQDATAAIPSVPPADIGEPTAAYMAYAAAGPRPDEPDQVVKLPTPMYKKWWFWVTAAVVLLIIIGAAVGSSKKKNSDATATTAATATTSAPPVTVTRATAPPTTSTPPPTTTPPTTAPPVTSPPVTSPPATAPASQAAPTTCSPVAASGNCYSAGEFCSNADHGLNGTTASGEAITCEDNNGWRWEPS
jgi:hypothetical protein